MTEIFLPQKKLLLPFMQDIEEIANPLSYVGVKFFNYVKIWEDGTRIDLNNNHIDFLDYYYYQSTDYKDQSLESNPFKFDENLLVWSSFPTDKTFGVLRNDFNIDHGITFIEKFDHCCELFHFAGDKDNVKIINYYLSNLDYLKAFMAYFKDKAFHIIKKAEAYKIRINDHTYDKTKDKLDSGVDSEYFLKQLNINKFYLDKIVHGDYLTKREAECLYLILHGKSSKEIGKKLKISYRTVESYLSALKIKYGVSNMYELMEAALTGGFFDAIPAILFENLSKKEARE